jgi:hypothetical protein
LYVILVGYIVDNKQNLREYRLNIYTW